VRNAKCKQIETNCYSGHWSSAEMHPRTPIKSLTPSKSVSKATRSLQEGNFRVFSKQTVSSNFSPEKKTLVVLPSLENLNLFRSLPKSRPLISVKKSTEKEIKPIDWVQPFYRLGFVGGMFSQIKEKNKVQVSREVKIEKELKIDHSFDEMFFEYKEPYLQYILEKKIKKINDH
jgi:hypothetical protein